MTTGKYSLCPPMEVWPV